MAAKPISRRRLLKTGCLTVAGVGLAVGGVGLAIPAPDQAPIDLPSFAYGENWEKIRGWAQTALA